MEEPLGACSRGGKPRLRGNLPFGDQEPVSGDAEGCVVVKSSPASAPVMGKAHLLLEFLIVALDPPAHGAPGLPARQHELHHVEGRGRDEHDAGHATVPGVAEVPAAAGEVSAEEPVKEKPLPSCVEAQAKEFAAGEAMAEDVVRLLDHLKLQQAHVIGYSMGGMITLKLLVKHPERVKSAVLGGMGWLKTGGVLQQTWERMPSREGAAVPPACVRGLGRLAVTETELKAVRVPVTVIVGERDPVRRLYVEPLQIGRAHV